MSIDAPHPQLLRGLQLKELGRYADAESAFKEALSQEPNDAFVLHQLAGCQWQIPGRHKYALRPREKTEAAVVGGGLVLGVFSVIASFALANFGLIADAALFIGLGCIASSFPLSLTFTNQSKPGAWIFGSVGAAALLATLAILLALWVPALPQKSITSFFFGSCVACLACTWLGNIPALNRRG